MKALSSATPAARVDDFPGELIPSTASPSAHLGSFPFDPSFPQLERATDPERMLEVFRAHLRPVEGRAVEIVDCAPFRFRCRQSETRCVLQYTLQLVEPGSGRRWGQWVTGLIYAEPGEAERVWRALRAGEPGPEIPEAWRTLEPVGFIPELDMVVEVFPYDRRLPQLSRVMNGAMRDLEPLLLARLGPGRWQAGEPAIAPSRYRTELGAVLRVGLPARDTTSGRRETAACYLKVYRNERGRETFELLRSWAEEARPGRPYALVRPIAYMGDLRTLVIEEAPGTSLQHRLLEARDPVAATRSVARAVAAFHQDPRSIPRREALEDHIGQLERASTILQWALPELRDEARAITATVVSHLEEAPPAPVHGDLKPDHVFLADGRVIFVDLDSITLGDPARDAAHFCSYVAAGVGLEALPPGTGRRLAREFAEEYFLHVPDAWRRQFGLHLAGALIEVACGIFRHQEPWWREKSRAAIAEARRALDGQAWPAASWSGSRAPIHPGVSSLTGVELALMHALWARGEATAIELAQDIDDHPARSTVARRLLRLEALGAVRHRVEGRQSLYQATVGQADVRRSFVEDMAGRVDELFDGDRAAMVCQLMRARDVKPGDVERLLVMLQAGERLREEKRHEDE